METPEKFSVQPGNPKYFVKLNAHFQDDKEDKSQYKKRAISIIKANSYTELQKAIMNRIDYRTGPNGPANPDEIIFYILNETTNIYYEFFRSTMDNRYLREKDRNRNSG